MKDQPQHYAGYEYADLERMAEQQNPQVLPLCVEQLGQLAFKAALNYENLQTDPKLHRRTNVRLRYVVAGASGSSLLMMGSFTHNPWVERASFIAFGIAFLQLRNLRWAERVDNTMDQAAYHSRRLLELYQQAANRAAEMGLTDQ